MQDTNGHHDPSAAAAAGALHQHSSLLASILAELRAEQTQVGVSNATRQGMVLDNHPVAGIKRVLSYRTGNGYAAFASVASPGSLVLPANEGRMGLYISNSGATNPVTLYLGTGNEGVSGPLSGVPCIYLPISGAAPWNGLIGRALWCGDVWAVGVSTLVVAEV